MKNEGSEKNDNEGGGWSKALTTMARVSQIGFIFVFSLLISEGIGYWLDNVLGTGKIFKLVFLLIGVLAGLTAVKNILGEVLEK